MSVTKERNGSLLSNNYLSSAYAYCVYTESQWIFSSFTGHDDQSSLRTFVLGEHHQKPLRDPELQELKPLFYSSIKANPSGYIYNLIHPSVLNFQEFWYWYILCGLILLRTIK